MWRGPPPHTWIAVGNRPRNDTFYGFISIRSFVIYLLLDHSSRHVFGMALTVAVVVIGHRSCEMVRLKLKWNAIERMFLFFSDSSWFLSRLNAPIMNGQMSKVGCKVIFFFFFLYFRERFMEFQFLIKYCQLDFNKWTDNWITPTLLYVIDRYWRERQEEDMDNIVRRVSERHRVREEVRKYKTKAQPSKHCPYRVQPQILFNYVVSAQLTMTLANDRTND